MMVEKVESHKSTLQDLHLLFLINILIELHLSMIENEFLLLQIKDSDEELVEDQIFPDRLNDALSIYNFEVIRYKKLNFFFKFQFIDLSFLL